jgi:hypothetical protein
LKGTGKAKDQGELLGEKEGGSWLEAPLKLGPEAAAALADPLKFENMSHIFTRVTPLILVLCFMFNI